MKKWAFLYQFLIVSVSIIILTGCNPFGSTDSTSGTPPVDTTNTQDNSLSEPESTAVSQSQQGPSTTDDIWQDVAQDQLTVQSSDRLIYAEKFRLLSANLTILDNVLSQAPAEGSAAAQSTETVLPLPLPDGTFGRFRIEESPIMEPNLASQFPDIKTYAGVGLDDTTATARLDRTPAGFHGMILSSSGTVYIDPYSRGDIVHYMSYYKRDYTNFWGKSFNEVTPEGIEEPEPQVPPAPARSGPTLRTYRLAVGATGEYTQFHDALDGTPGDGVADALAAINTTINRVNGIYEREVSIRMNLIANNNLAIYTDGTIDPYTNDDGGTMLGENQTNLDTVIGNGNYDIGHVFSTGGGGIAGLGVICNNTFKAEGVTGQSIPIGDPFDVDFVAHEMGHQFGAEHTFNADGADTGSCEGNRESTTAYEPGSGSTIMGYAGICVTQDFKLNSDDYFHGISIDQIINYATTGTGSTCGTSTPTSNSVPTVEAGPNYSIPRQTPFTLTGSGQDTEGDPLTYGWEEFDTGAAWTNAAVLPNTDADGNVRPIFRSYLQTATPSRTFPELSSILDGTNSNNGESLPNIGRAMQFRLTVRDGRGGVNHDDMTVTVEEAAGPFAVTSPNTAVTWTGNSSQNITWDVANTTAAPVSCANVNILLATDGGNTFATALASNTPNDGTEMVMVPNSATNTARVKVECADNIFFDISNTNFAIEESTPPDNLSLTVNIIGNGTVSKNPDQPTYPAGTVVTLEAIPDPGWVFVGWSDDLSGNANPSSITMDSDKTVTVTFQEVPPDNFTLTVNVVGNGSVARNPDQPTYPAGTVVTLEAIPDPGWVFVGWSGDLSGNANPSSITMDSNKTVTATFTPETVKEYTLTVNIVGNGTVTKVPNQASYPAGTNVTLTATPATGWFFVGWSGDLIGNVTPVIITMDRDKTVTASFGYGSK